MKIAVTYSDGQIFQHFGHTEHFKVYEAADGKVVRSEILDTNGSGHGALAGFLADQGVGALICGGIGGGAQTALARVGIKLYAGVSGDADTAVKNLLSGTLAFSTQANCGHHSHEQGQACGEHGCGGGGHTCGA
ncbi:NifB/NifX family molybdenum-iron cluster-binding protein [Allofournierella sp.]|uniref:NifB/NifX family molybdenum-iron cluster-binding protein n=1 Tax=Allofournierella sp. TaxID=1940256 RepID=UPI003AB61EAC